MFLSWTGMSSWTNMSIDKKKYGVYKNITEIVR